jgi:transcriptional regulator with XRE-family HTH domain
MKERIIEFLRKENKSAAQLAEEIGVQPSGISHILSGRNKPSLDFVIKMLEKYNFLSTDWLLFGTGDMYKVPAVQNLFNEPIIGTRKDEAEDKQHVNEHEKISEYTEATQDIKSKLKGSSVEKIVWFYSDNSFREFIPGDDQ